MDFNKIKGLALAFIATASWASFYIISRYFFGTDDDGLDPLWSSFLRYLLASGVLFACSGAMKQIPASLSALRNDWKMLFLLGLVGIAGESTLLFYSMKFTTAARSNLLTNISPILTALLSWIITREVFDRKQIAGMAMGGAGMVIIFFLRGGDDFTAGNASFLTGDVMALAAGACWSLFTVLGERAVRQYGPQVIMGWAFLFGALVMIPIMFLSGSRITFKIGMRGWLMILYIGLVSNAMANVCWYAALKYLKPGELGAFGYVSIILTVVLAFCFLGERITLPFLLCLAMILAGTALMLKISRPGKTE